MSLDQQGDEHQSLSEQSKNIRTGLATFSTSSVTAVSKLLIKSYTDLPVSEAAVGCKESKDLTKARTELTLMLATYKNLHLPLSIVLVNDLRETLVFFQKGYEDFIKLIPFVKEQVQEGEERATLVHELYVQLAVDLERLGEDANKKLNAAALKVQERKAAAESKSGHAKTAQYGAAGIALTGLGGENAYSLTLCCCRVLRF